MSRCPRQRSMHAKSVLDRLRSDRRPARCCRFRRARTDCRRHGRTVVLHPASRGQRPGGSALSYHAVPFKPPAPKPLPPPKG